ncbi:hypothetical protein PGT21_027734 [Puccinia graminis f. sp. tritici]|uniref:Uncharacterized protein n=1 Tax=Puccinia graminis f. sp. tritici TaxID=56615 RepID=A0A5B0MNX6_PUCGR|nr:hypothetical protein PGT21_027734 [Puccinia graminis f. sp. tritici]
MTDSSTFFSGGNLAAWSPRFLRPSEATNPSSLNSRRAYSLWPFGGSGSSKPSPPTEEQSAAQSPVLEKPAESIPPITAPETSPSTPVKLQLKQILELTSASQELARSLSTNSSAIFLGGFESSSSRAKTFPRRTPRCQPRASLKTNSSAVSALKPPQLDTVIQPTPK